MSNLLSQIRTIISVDIDSMSPAVARRHTDSSTLFCDTTSNQAIVHNEGILSENADILQNVLEYVRNNGLNLCEELDVLKAMDLLAVLLAKRIYPYITGNVLVQTSPSFAFDTELTTAHAKDLVATFEANGIPRNRVCIKIPTTAESIVACKYLEKIGIRTLATCLFSVSQAVAASQAGCLYIAPYFNELAVHFEPSLWKEYKDTLDEHPVIPIIQDIIKAYQALGTKTLVMPASIVTVAEVIALTKLRPDHLTLSGSVLDKLASTPAMPEDLLSEVDLDPCTSREVLEVNYLANNAESLKKSLGNDAEATRKLQDAIRIFSEMENQTKEFICAKFSGNVQA